MRWRRGEQTLQAYEHYFDAVRHAEIQDRVHARFDDALRARVTGSDHGPAGAAAGAPAVSPAAGVDEPEWTALRRFSGAS
jgi:hypothetical protein